ncbi:MAG: TIGR01777 family oxidoreductase [Bacteroidia bacterium]|nr:TIGR01777 family oxidoreductase [Bacteroidia bacterium]
MLSTFILTGATGLIGRRVYRALRERGNDVVVLSRNPERAKSHFPDAAQVLLWAPGVAGAWSAAIDGCAGVIHLAGEPIAEERWTEEYKKRIHGSRVDGTREIVDAIASAGQKPAVLVSVSGVGYYGDTRDVPVDEDSPAGSDFLAGVCVEWENEAHRAEDFGVRVVTPRLGIVLADDGGALEKLLTPFKMFAGGPVGNGEQWFPWVHIDDVVGLILHAIETQDLHGVVNAVSPGLVRNREFAIALGEALKRPARFTVPGFVIKLALGEFGETLLGGQRVSPRRTLESGYNFKYTDIEKALGTLVSV